MAKLHFKYGTMNSSKTAQLIMVNHNFLEQGKKTLVFKPKIDNRDGEEIKSRALSETISPIIIDSNEHKTMYKLAKKHHPSCILIDEVQFFSEKQIEELSDIVDDLNIPIIAYGLLTDFKGDLFTASKKLIELSDEKEEIENVCLYCNNKAMFNMRFEGTFPIFDGDSVKIGGNESYKSVCRKCFKISKELWKETNGFYE